MPTFWFPALRVLGPVMVILPDVSARESLAFQELIAGLWDGGNIGLCACSGDLRGVVRTQTL